ncbi:MAG TPA: UbiA family prenyltransferase [Nakamurella sp.]
MTDRHAEHDGRGVDGATRRQDPVSGVGTVAVLLRAAHIGPTLAVTALAAALSVAAGTSAGRIILIAAAVLAGQLTIGWSNDLIDRSRDRSVGRADKPLATGELAVRTVTIACAFAVLAVVVLSLLCGIVAGVIHLGCVAAGWAYNLGLKRTVWSWAPYALAFGGLTVFVSLAAGAGLPEPWVPTVAAMLGVGAHLVNALPDLADDEATGVRGLPHRLGAGRTRVLAVIVLTAASCVVAVASREVSLVLRVGALLVVAALAAVALLTRGRVPFRAAIAIAIVDAVLLVAAR